MSKRIVLVFVVLLVLPMMLTACGTESRDNAEDYVKAVMKGEAEKAGELVCDSYTGTDDLIALYAAAEVDPDSLSLKFDMGKGNNKEEIIVTGAVKYGPDAKEFEIAGNARMRDLPAAVVAVVVLEKEADADADEDTVTNVDTRLVLTMKEEGGDWCVKDVDLGDIKLGTEAEEAGMDEAEEPADADAADTEDADAADADAENADETATEEPSASE
ncbi:MAG: hypothetical protein JXQ72_10145 [Anaerolineae bacterium]|nr:hypothetical protein [Anaerolineae bacterium]